MIIRNRTISRGQQERGISTVISFIERGTLRVRTRNVVSLGPDPDPDRTRVEPYVLDVLLDPVIEAIDTVPPDV